MSRAETDSAGIPVGSPPTLEPAPPPGPRPSAGPPHPAAHPAPAWRRRARRLLLWGLAALAVAAVVAYWTRPTPVDVSTATVTRGPLAVTVDEEGVTRVRDRYQVAAPVAGRLLRIRLRAGDAVAAGMPVAELAPVPLDDQAARQARSRVDAAAAAVRAAAAQAAQAAAQAERAARAAGRQRALWSAGAISDDAREQAELAAAVAQRESEAARARLRSAHAEEEAARAVLPALAGPAVVVRAPAAGRVLRVPESSERVVPAGTPLLEVGDAEGLEVVAELLSTDAVRVRPGAPMEVVEWGGDRPLRGRVRRVEPSGFTKVSALGIEEQRVNVIGDVPEAPGLGDGYRVEVRIETWRAGDVLKVPTSALFRRAGGWGVYVVESGRARLRSVGIGHRSDAEAEVLRGLRPGETVVVFPPETLEEGGRVRAAAD